jgi:hypothetical protein
MEEAKYEVETFFLVITAELGTIFSHSHKITTLK